MARLSSLTINDTGALVLPGGLTSQRTAMATTIAQFTATGGTTWTCPAGVYSVEVLVVAGGGGGGRHSGGGGGGGGVLYRPSYRVTPGTVYTVTVGGGGSVTIGTYPGVGGASGTNGGNSVFDTITAIGGGGGGWAGAAGQLGGSGGGSTGHATYGAGAGTDGQGFAGGNTAVRENATYCGAGGGGAGGPGKGGTGGNLTDVIYSITTSAGATVTTKYSCGGDGGPGVFYNISGQERAYGGGGGGSPQYGALPSGSGGAGGSGVGGTGSPSDGQTEGSQYGYNGQANTGGGGGGSHYNAPATATAGREGKGGSGVVIVRYNADNTMAVATGAMRVNTQSGLEFKAGDSWKPVFLPFLQRTIISNAYTMGGYKDAVPWSTVNRTVAATDTTTNIGDLLPAPSNYKGGAGSKNIYYLFGVTSTNAGASNVIGCFNMRNETAYTSAGTTTLQVSAAYNGVAFKEHYKAYTHQAGAGTGIEEFNMITETSVGVTANIFQDNGWAMSTENHGIFYASDGGSNRNYSFATNTPTTRGGTGVSAHHQQKSVQSKLTNCWAGNEGTYNGGNSYRRTNMVTDSTSGTMAKPSTNCGEENYTMGQDHQYMIGTYNGSGQVNVSSKFFYASESGVTGGASMEPKGHLGQSSAVCGWRD